jgi:addiction module HigA family antidote
MSGKLKPVHPGFILREEFMEPLGISQNRLSIAIGVDVRRINSIVQGKRTITPDTALRLGVFFKTGPKVWLNLQQEYDLRVAEREIEAVLKKIEPAETVAA